MFKINGTFGKKVICKIPEDEISPILEIKIRIESRKQCDLPVITVMDLWRYIKLDHTNSCNYPAINFRSLIFRFL